MTDHGQLVNKTKETPMLPPSPKLGTNCSMVETPPPLTQYQQQNAHVSALAYPLGSMLTGEIFDWRCPPGAVASSSQKKQQKRQR
jgi:hypothetical protein